MGGGFWRVGVQGLAVRMCIDMSVELDYWELEVREGGGVDGWGGGAQGSALRRRWGLGFQGSVVKRIGELGSGV